MQCVRHARHLKNTPPHAKRKNCLQPIAIGLIEFFLRALSLRLNVVVDVTQLIAFYIVSNVFSHEIEAILPSCDIHTDIERLSLACSQDNHETTGHHKIRMRSPLVKRNNIGFFKFYLRFILGTGILIYRTTL